MNDIKFDPKKLQKLNNPARLADIPLDEIQRRLPLEPHKVIVDLGAGTAFFSVAFLERFNPETIYACDLSETMIQWIRENVCPAHPRIKAIQTRESAVPLDDGVSDLIFMIALHHELENPSRFMDEAFRLLKPGGQVLIVDWLRKQMTEGPPVEIRCLPETVRVQLTQAGFIRVRVHPNLTKHFMVTGEKDKEGLGCP